MAKFTVSGLDDVQEAMLRREKATMEAVPEMLKAGGEVIRRAFQEETQKLNSTGRGTGDLAASMKVSAVKERGGGSYVDIAPTGTDRHGVRNAEKGFVLNYGRKNMPARPWFTTANAKAADEATAEMRRVWEEKQNGR